MVRREDVMRQLESGNGGKPLELADWLEAKENCPNLELVSTVILPAGSQAADHVHDGECEIYRVISGTVDYNDNGKQTKLGPGDTAVCYDGQTHGMMNNTDEDFVFIAVIVKG